MENVIDELHMQILNAPNIETLTRDVTIVIASSKKSIETVWGLLHISPR